MAERRTVGEPPDQTHGGKEARGGPRVWARLRDLLRARDGDASLRETIEEIIEEVSEGDNHEETAPAIGDDERVLLANILKLRHLTAYDIMVPRADIVAVDVGTGLDELMEAMSRGGHSRLPVYRDTLDDVIGFVHIKDVLPYADRREAFRLMTVTRTALFVAPSMRILDLLWEMRLSRIHMALVVDEFGGIDGLLTTEDVVEEIVGEIEDEHDVAEGPRFSETRDSALIANARATVEEFEQRVGPVLSDEERAEDIDTLGGLVASIAGRVPTRGELIVHGHSGISFEIMEADPRRIKRLRIRNLPGSQTAPTSDA